MFITYFMSSSFGMNRKKAFMAGLLASMSTMAMVYPVHARDVAASGDSFEDIAVADDGLVDEPNIAKKDADRGVDDDGRTITVIATRNADYVIDYPGSVTVIDSDVLRDIAPANLNDIFDQIPGTNIDGGPRRAGNVPTIRGQSGEGVLIYIDGARQSYQSGHDGRVFLDPAVLQAVEVVRGPTSALYGSGALGGTISFRTQTADSYLNDGEQMGGQIRLGYQDVAEQWLWSGTMAARSSDSQFDFLGNVNFRTSHDIQLGSGLDLPDEDNVFSSLAKFTWRPSDIVTASVSWTKFLGDSRDPNNAQGVNQVNASNLEVSRQTNSDTVQFVTNINPDTNWIDANFTAYYGRNQVDEDERGTARIVGRTVESWGVSLDNRTSFDIGESFFTRFTYGGEIYEDKQSGYDNATADGSRGGVPDATRRFYGAFIQGELEWNSPIGEWTIIPAVRWDRFENMANGFADTSDDHFSPKVGASWKPIPELILFGNWAEAFRAPSYNEIYADNVHFQLPVFTGMGPPTFVSNNFIPNPDLKPEESETIEFGAGVDFGDVLQMGDRLMVKGNWWRSDVDDLISLDVNIPAGCFGAPFPPCGSGAAFGNYTRNVNVTNARVKGVEIEGSYDNDYVFLRANFSHITGRDRDNGEYVGSLQPDIFFIDGGVKIPNIDVRLGGRLTLAGTFTKVDDVNEYRDSYERGDIYAIWAPTSGFLKGFRVDLGINNVADTDYEVVAAGVSEPGRNYKAMIGWSTAY